MSHLEQKVKDILDEKNKSFKWLSDQLGYSRQGLKNGLVNKTIKFETLEKISEVLNIPIGILTDSRTQELKNVDMSEFFSNRIVKLSINRFDKVSDKLSYMKDVFIWEVIWKIKNYYIPSYPFVIPGKPENLLNKPEDINFFEIISSHSIDKPFSKMPDHIKTSLFEFEHLFEGFYFTIFYLNLFNINNYLSDGVIQDNEIIKFWKAWNKVKNEVEKLNWLMVTE